jgi:hypothetical protein
MVNYEKSIIYKLCCKDPSITDEYVGSTVNFTRRKCCHKCRCNSENGKHYNLKVYQYIRENGGWDNWDMVEVEKYNAEDKQDLHSRERFWFEELGATLNTQMPLRSATEYRQQNKVKMAEYQTEYRQQNKVKMVDYSSEYYQRNKEKISKRNMEFYQKNKEKFSNRNMEYRQKNKERIAKCSIEKVTCECESVLSRCNLTNHRKSVKHKKLMEYKLSL